MGSFNSAPKINNADTQDDCIEIPNGLSTTGLLHHCTEMRGQDRPQLLPRQFLKPMFDNAGSIDGMPNDLTDGMKVLHLNSVSQGKFNYCK